MTTTLQRLGAGSLTAVFMGLTLAFMPVAGVDAARKSSVAPAGNNGTLQIVEQGDTEYKRSNDPKVCTFRFEVFGLDANQTGTVTIASQSPNDAKGTEALQVALTTDENGDGATAYINAADKAYALASGHYKAELDNKFGTKKNEKAKSKVFKITCEQAAVAGTTKPNENKPSTKPAVLGANTTAPAEAGKAGELANTGASVSAIVTTLVGLMIGGIALAAARLTRRTIA